MATLVVNESGDIVATGVSAERGDFQGEKGLIKVTVEGGYFYIGTNDRDSYTFVTAELPDGFRQEKFKVVDGALVAKT